MFSVKIRVVVLYFWVVCFFSLPYGVAKAENPFAPGSDMALLQGKETEERNHIHQHDVRFMRTRSSNFFVRYNPVSILFGGLMYTYQKVISPQLPSECLYVETCSHFSKSLIAEYGLLKGVFTTSDRLMRCNRISALDVHPMLIDPDSGKVVESVDIYKSQP